MNDYLERAPFQWVASELEEIARTDPDFDVSRQNGMRPLIDLLGYNRRGKYTGAITILLDRGARVDPERHRWVCPLENCYTAADVELLVRYGADVSRARYLTGGDMRWALCDAGHNTWSYLSTTGLMMVLAHPRFCEDLARLVVELAQ